MNLSWTYRVFIEEYDKQLKEQVPPISLISMLGNMWLWPVILDKTKKPIAPEWANGN